MTILNRLYASSGPEVIIETLQINIGMMFTTCATGMRILPRRQRTAIP
jgi:hypothetical protein